MSKTPKVRFGAGALLVSVLLALTACFDFKADLATCRDGGRCVPAANDGGGGPEGDGGENDGGGQDAFDAGPFQAILCTPTGVCWENPWPTGQHLSAIAEPTPGDVWLGGDYGSLFHSVNGEWTAMRVGADPVYWYDDRPNALVPASDGRLLHLTHEGVYEIFPGAAKGVFIHTPGNNMDVSEGLWREAEGKAVLVGSRQVSGNSDTRGVIWDFLFDEAMTPAVDTDQTLASYNALLSYADGGLLVVGQASAARFDDTGWTVLDGGTVPGFVVWSGWVGSDGTSWIAGETQAACDGDGGWNPIPQATQSELVKIAGAGSTAWLSFDDVVMSCPVCGAPCDDRSPPASFFGELPDKRSDIETVRGFGDHLWIVGANGLAARADANDPDAGFTLINRGPRASFRAVYAGGWDDAWAVGNGVAAHRTATGWEPVTVPPDDYFTVFRDPKSNVLLLAGFQFAIRQTADGGFKAAPIYGPTGLESGMIDVGNFAFTAIHGDPATGTFAVTDDAKFVEWRNDHYEERPSAPSGTQFNTLFVTDAGVVWAAGQGAGVFSYTADGGWAKRTSTAFAGDENFVSVFAPSANEVFLAGQDRGYVVHLTPDPANDERLDVPTIHAWAITGNGQGDVWAIGALVAHRPPGGQFEAPRDPQTDQTYSAATMLNGRPLAVGSGGSIVVIDK